MNEHKNDDKKFLRDNRQRIDELIKQIDLYTANNVPPQIKTEDKETLEDLKRFENYDNLTIELLKKLLHFISNQSEVNIETLYNYKRDYLNNAWVKQFKAMNEPHIIQLENDLYFYKQAHDKIKKTDKTLEDLDRHAKDYQYWYNKLCNKLLKLSKNKFTLDELYYERTKLINERWLYEHTKSSTDEKVMSGNERFFYEKCGLDPDCYAECNYLPLQQKKECVTNYENLAPTKSIKSPTKSITTSKNTTFVTKNIKDLKNNNTNPSESELNWKNNKIKLHYWLFKDNQFLAWVIKDQENIDAFKTYITKMPTEKYDYMQVSKAYTGLWGARKNFWNHATVEVLPESNNGGKRRRTIKKFGRRSNKKKTIHRQKYA